VIPIEMNTDGVLHPPDDVSEVGWWQRSAKPGAHTGQTLLTGHTVSSGGGVMDDLGELEAGDRVRVKSPRGTVIYETTRVRDYSTEQVAAQARKLFGQDREDGRLVLVTCSDWNGEVYESNTIVFAERIGARKTEGTGGSDTAALAAP
jgi:LPXTG-site transpeptidase (sortase) family protein